MIFVCNFFRSLLVQTCLAMSFRRSSFKRQRVFAKDVDAGSLQRMLSDPALSFKSLKRVADAVSTDPDIVQQCSYQNIQAAVRLEYEAFNTTLVMERIGGGEVTLPLCEPNMLLMHLLQEAPQLAEWYGEAANVHGCGRDHPWRMVLAFDEFTPGDPLKPTNTRKIMVVSFNFIQLGSELLSRADTWVTPLVIRHTMLETISGGFSRVLRDFLKLQLLGPNGLLTVGVPLMVNGAPLTIFAKVQFLLGDGDGLRLALDWRGAGSLKPCFRHGNVWKAGSDMARRIEGHVEHTCADPSLFKTTSAHEFEQIVDHLIWAKSQWSAGLMTKSNFEKLQKVAGTKCNPLSFFADPELRPHVKPTEIVTVDWMHSLLQDGVLAVDASLFLQAAGIQYSRLEHYLKADWTFPKWQHNNIKPHKIFNSQRARSHTEAGKLKCQASELLAVYGLIRHFVQTRVPDEPGLHLKRASFLAACSVVDILLEAKHGRMPFAQALILTYSYSYSYSYPLLETCYTYSYALYPHLYL